MVTLSLLATIEGHEAQFQRLRAAGYTLDIYTLPRALTEDEVAQRIPGVRAWIAGTDRFTRRSLAAADRLEVISRWGVGYDAVDLEACNERGIAVTTTIGGNDAAVAEMTFGFIFALAREIVWADTIARRRTWERLLIGGSSPLGKTLGIVGMGRIGITLARLATAVGIEVQYHDALGAVAPPDLGARFVTLDELLASSDFVTLHVPLVPATHHLISTRELGLMKKTAYLINTSRGPVVDEQALLDALRAKQIAGAALDVFEKEPVDPKNPLLDIEERVILTPHIAGISAEAKRLMLEMAVTSTLAVLGGELPPTVVNRPTRAPQASTRRP